MGQNTLIGRRSLSVGEIVVIVGLACVPLFATFPYRVNIFLSWEGAYRMSRGQLPFRDFGVPLGGMFWVIPAFFFKIFGPKMITLIKAQVFINILSGLAFRSILKSCKLPVGIRFVSVLLFCISYSFFNFWPWYNHSVIVYELIALAFLFRYITGSDTRFRIGWLLAAALFTCFSFLTKQDGGGMAFGIACVLLAGHSWYEKKWVSLLVYISAVCLFFAAIIAPFLPYHFGYWFNHGQPPHTARISISEILSEFLGASEWIKFYLLLIALLLLLRFRHWKELFADRQLCLFLLLTLCMLGEAAVFQVTSYTPPDNNIFFHSFAVAFILYLLARQGPVDFNKPVVVAVCTAGVMIWWSSTYWKYIERVTNRLFPAETATVSPTGENIVNRHTYMISADTNDIPTSKWVFSGLKTFDRIYMPAPTVAGMKRLLNMKMVKAHKDLKVLNMSELTPLAVEMPYAYENGPQYPLWYHLGVGMFNKQAEMFEKRIRQHYYDLVLFEYVPNLNNFYPFRVRDSLRARYQLVDSFYAPRRGPETMGRIEVYVRPGALPAAADTTATN